MILTFTNGKIWAFDPGPAGELISRGLGEDIDGRLLLSPEEALYLLEKRKSVHVVDENGNELLFPELMKFFSRKDKKFPSKYLVYRDMKDRGYVVKTGFKFGTHFRAYPRGVKPGEGHSHWLIHVADENKKVSFTELSRTVRLAQNVRKKLVFAIVDKEGDIVYYKIERFTP